MKRPADTTKKETETATVPFSIQEKEIHFIGKPGMCVGHIGLTNSSAEKVRLKRIPLVSSKLHGPAEVDVPHFQIFARLSPGASAQIPAVLQLPPQTPPGRYVSEALIGSEHKRVVIDVVESWDIAFAPAEISLKLRRGERAQRFVQFTNRGNVPWRLHRAAFAPLHEVDGVHRNVFLSLKNTPEGKYEEVLNDFLKRMRETEVEPASIKILAGPEILQAGESINLEIEISLPTNLRKNCRYSGKASFENARLSLDIEIIENGAPLTKEQK